MKKCILICVLIALVFMNGCKRYMVYRNSCYNFDSSNLEITIREGYMLDEGHSYDLAETEEGYDITFHFVKENGGVRE